MVAKTLGLLLPETARVLARSASPATLVVSAFHAQSVPTMASKLALLRAMIVRASARQGSRAKLARGTLHARKHAKTAACRKELLLAMTADALVPWVSPGRRVKRWWNARWNARTAASRLDLLPAAIVRVSAHVG